VEIGDRHEIDGVQYEIVSAGLYDGEKIDVQEGRVPMEGDSAYLFVPEDDPEHAFLLEQVEVIEHRERMARLELEMDGLMPGVRAALLLYEERDDPVPVEVVGRLLRAACATGYQYGVAEEPRGALHDRVRSGGG
jgi:hypothetical protein